MELIFLPRQACRRYPRVNLAEKEPPQIRGTVDAVRSKRFHRVAKLFKGLAGLMHSGGNRRLHRDIEPAGHQSNAQVSITKRNQFGLAQRHHCGKWIARVEAREDGE